MLADGSGSVLFCSSGGSTSSGGCIAPNHDITGYNGAVIQVLGHDTNNCEIWITAEDCGSSGSGATGTGGTGSCCSLKDTLAKGNDANALNIVNITELRDTAGTPVKAVSVANRQLWSASGGGTAAIIDWSGTNANTAELWYNYSKTGMTFKNAIVDTAGSAKKSVDTNIRYLYDDAGNATVNWDGTALYSNIDQYRTLDWTDRILYTEGTTQTPVFNWSGDTYSGRMYYDTVSGGIAFQNPIIDYSAQLVSADTSYRQLYTTDGLTATLDWGSNLYLQDIDGVSSLLWGDRTLHDSLGTATVNWSGLSGITVAGNAYYSSLYVVNQTHDAAVCAVNGARQALLGTSTEAVAAVCGSYITAIGTATRCIYATDGTHGTTICDGTNSISATHKITTTGDITTTGSGKLNIAGEATFSDTASMIKVGGNTGQTVSSFSFIGSASVAGGVLTKTTGYMTFTNGILTAYTAAT